MMDVLKVVPIVSKDVELSFIEAEIDLLMEDGQHGQVLMLQKKREKIIGIDND